MAKKTKTKAAPAEDLDIILGIEDDKEEEEEMDSIFDEMEEDPEEEEEEEEETEEEEEEEETEEEEEEEETEEEEEEEQPKATQSKKKGKKKTKKAEEEPKARQSKKKGKKKTKKAEEEPKAKQSKKKGKKKGKKTLDDDDDGGTFDDVVEGDEEIETPVYEYESKVIKVKDLVSTTFDRSKQSLEDVAALAENIRRVGLITPLLVSEDKNGKYRVLAGNRRLAAVTKLKWLDVPCHVVTCEGEDGAADEVMSLSDNMYHMPPDPISQAETFAKLLKKKEFKTQEDMAKAFGVTQSLISQRLKLLDAPDEVKDAVRRGEMTAQAAAAAADRKRGNKPGKATVKFTSLPKEDLIPDGEETPTGNLGVKVAPNEVRVTVAISFAALKKNGVLASLTSEVEKIGDEELKNAIVKFRRTI